MTLKSGISENSSRIAKNTMLLYFRMLLLLFIGLFTSRVVLQALGEQDYGVYNAVGGVVSLFTFITASISSAVSRYLAHELAGGDENRLRKVFSTSVAVQLILAACVAVLVETVGLWCLNHIMDIPADRRGIAFWVLQLSLLTLMINMFAVPFNAAIIAHEKMGAFAMISILEAVLKLGVALLLFYSSADTLILYAILMAVVSLLVRSAYGIYSHRMFPETKARLSVDGKLLREMLGFTGWNIMGSGTYVLNTHGLNIASNSFFGVLVNASRGVALNVEGIVKQFATNFMTALNPQIVKSYSSGNHGYCFTMVNKGVKYVWLVILFFAVPVFYEADMLLSLWLVNVPESAPLFVRLTLLCLFADIVSNPVLQLILAHGRVREYYLCSGAVSILVLPLVCILFHLGAEAHAAYLVFAAAYLIVSVIRVIFAVRLTSFPVSDLLFQAVIPCLMVTQISFAAAFVPWYIIPAGVWRLISVLVAGSLAFALSTWFCAMTVGEKEFVFRKLSRFLPDSLFLRWKYRLTFGRRLHLNRPVAFTEKLQWTKIHDRNPLYHQLVDKFEVKKYVAEKIGEEHIIPTIGVWENFNDIDFSSLPNQFVLKCTHDSGSTIVCTDRVNFDVEDAARRLGKALSRDFYTMSREWAYKGVRPRIIAEKYMGDDLPDYKFFCSDGKVRFMFIATDRNKPGEEVKFDFFDAAFNHLDVKNGHPNAEVTPSKPAGFEKMMELASRLSEGIPQVRIDFYEKDGNIYFGEYTFCHFGGFVPFEPDSMDYRFGEWIEL